MKPFLKWSLSAFAAVGLMAAPQAASAQDCETIELGAAI